MNFVWRPDGVKLLPIMNRFFDGQLSIAIIDHTHTFTLPPPSLCLWRGFKVCEVKTKGRKPTVNIITVPIIIRSVCTIICCKYYYAMKWNYTWLCSLVECVPPLRWLSWKSLRSRYLPTYLISKALPAPPPLGIVFWRKSHSAFFGAWTAAAGRPVRRYLFHLVARPYFYGFASQRTLCCHSGSKSNKCCKWQQRLLSASNTMATCLSAPRRLFVSSFVLCSAWLGQQL